MSGRRSHPRFALANPWDGALQVARDVVVSRADDHELVALSHLPGIVGEEMSLGVLGGGESVQMKVTVVESRPVIVDGALRHHIRLSVVHAEARDAEPQVHDVSAGTAAEAL